MVLNLEQPIPHLLETARALKRVRRMHQYFMLQWALEAAQEAKTREKENKAIPSHPFADPNRRDWRAMYRGNILDD